MCGVAGIITRRNNVDLRLALGAMSQAMAHRGPDGEGMLVREVEDWKIGLAHTRLAIIDLSSAGRQPMAGLRKSCWLSYNGEIYNFKELRQEMESQGQEFRSQTDSEVLLRAYETWGAQAISRFRGMFAFTIWDEDSRQLILARDPFGVKPLYYYQTEDSFIFASELRAMLASGLLPRRASMQGLASYLHYGSVQAPRTLLDGAYSLMPGQCMKVDLGERGLGVKQFHYGFSFSSGMGASAPARRKEAAAILRDILKESVRLQLVSDVPLGIFLSGGIDSSSLVALASLIGGRPKTFSIVFEEKNFSEQPYSRLIAQKFNTDHTEINFSETDLFHLLPRALASFDQPSVDGINTFIISKAVREAGIKVALSGLGGDELFAGYASFKRDTLIRNIVRIPRPLRRMLAELGAAAYGGSVSCRKAGEILGCDGTPYATYDISRELFSPSEIKKISEAAFNQDGMPPIEDEVETDRINAISAYELRGYMANTLLRDTDCMSMAHSLEVRVPFVDPMVVECVMRLPGDYKLERWRPKPLLLDALADLLPEEIWRRPKMGFSLPWERWMLSVLRPSLEEAFGKGAGLSGLGANMKLIHSMWDVFQSHPGKERWSRIWALHALDRWAELNGITAQ